MSFAFCREKCKVGLCVQNQCILHQSEEKVKEKSHEGTPNTVEAL